MVYSFVAYFFIYGFVGWCVEVTFKALQKGVLQNRGFLNGAICPIYGFGVCAVVLLLEPVKDNGWLLYFGSVVVTSLLELVTGFLMDKMFHKRWWDYSKMPLNIHGYVCLLFSLVWGFGCMFLVRIIHPVFEKLVELVPHTLSVVVLSLLSGVLVLDTVLTVLTVLKFNKKLKQIDEMSELMKQSSDKLTQILYKNAIKVEEITNDKFSGQIDELKQKYREGKDKYEELLVKANAKREEIEDYRRQRDDLFKLRTAQEKNKVLTFGQRRLLKAFPDATSSVFSRSMEELKASIMKIRTAKK